MFDFELNKSRCFQQLGTRSKMEPAIRTQPSSPFQRLLEDWMPQRLSYCNTSSVGCQRPASSTSSCLWGFWVMAILGGGVCLSTTTHPHLIPTITPPVRWPRTQRLCTSRTHKHWLSYHLSYIEAALECKQMLPLPLNCLWPRFVFRKGGDGEDNGWMLYLPSTFWSSFSVEQLECEMSFIWSSVGWSLFFNISLPHSC